MKTINLLVFIFILSINFLAVELSSIAQKESNDEEIDSAGNNPNSHKTKACLTFDGIDDYIKISSAPSKAIANNDFTFEAWIEGNEGEQTQHPIIFSNRKASNAGGFKFFFHDLWDGSNYKMLSVQLDWKNYLIVNNGTYNGSLLDGNCHHVAITLEGSTLFFYADGELFGTRTISGNPSLSSNVPLWIGSEQYSSNRFKGTISQVRMWKTARTATQLKNNMNESLSGNTTDLVSYWEVNENGGQTITDKTGLANGTVGQNNGINDTDPQWISDNLCCLEHTPCQIDDWTALKALYESTNGDNWTNREGWDTLIDGQTKPPPNCNLNNLFGVKLNDIGYVITLDLKRNQLSGNIPSELGNLSKLANLKLERNQLVGDIPAKLGNLSNLVDLRLSFNQLAGSIPSELSNLNNLKKLYLNYNQFTGNIPAELGNLNKLLKLFLNSNQLTGDIPKEIGNLGRLIFLSLHNNHLTGNIPTELGKLSNLVYLYLSNNKLNGNLPAELIKLGKLKELSISNNKITGSIPAELDSIPNLTHLYLASNELDGQVPSELGNLSKLEIMDLSKNNISGILPAFPFLPDLRIENNNFSCDDLSPNFNANNQKTNFTYSPQFYGDVQSYIVDTNTINNHTLQASELPATLNNPSYQWKKNGNLISGANSTTYALDDIQPNDAGVYTLHIEDDCILEIEFISKPYYVIYPGYDYYGQEVRYKQIMIEYDRTEMTDINNAIEENGGRIIDRCNCNGNLYLYEFPDDMATLQTLLDIDASTRTESIPDDDGDVDGGFNNFIRTIDSSFSPQKNSFQIPGVFNLAPTGGDEVKIFILDTGLDEDTCIDNTNLYDKAPVHNCINYDPLESGFSFSTQYRDEQGHGTFGYNLITKDLPDNFKVVPLKIFDKNGEGNLFDFVCAIYQAIEHNADIINISAGFNGQASKILERALYKAQEKEIFICAAAGNDTINNDILPQYPSNYAGMYHYEYDSLGMISDSTRYDNVISIAALNSDNELANFTNFGNESVTMASLGKNIAGKELSCKNVAASGTSFSTFLVSRYLALEIAKNNTRSLPEIWNDFEREKLIWNNNLNEKTISGKRLDINYKQTISKIANNTNVVDNDFSVQIINTTLKAQLIYNIVNEGAIKVNLYNNNGTFIQNLVSKIVATGQHQLPIFKNKLVPGIYFIQILYQPINEDQQMQILKMPILK